MTINSLNNLANQFNEKGYIILRDFLNKSHVKEMLDGFEKNLDFCISNISNIKLKNLDEKYLWLQKKNPSLKGRAYDVSKYHQSLYKISDNKILKKFLKKYFNEEYFYLDLPQIRADDSSNSRALPMHQEIHGQLSNKVVTLWAPLTKVSIKNGTMGVIPNSHKLGKIKHVFYKTKNNKYHGVTPQFLKKKRVKYFKLKAGDVVLFHPFLVHGTGKNFTKKIRWTYVVRLNALKGINYLKFSKNTLRQKQN